MHNVTDAEIDFILNDIKARGIVTEELRHNLLDHICCILEQEMPEGTAFEVFYHRIIQRFFTRELSELQRETDQLMRFKNFYAMKNTMKYTGFFSALLILLGGVFKINHMLGANVLFVLGMVTFSLIFLPLLLTLKMRDGGQGKDNVVFAVGLIIGMTASMGVMFKLMHWPFANILMQGSLGALILVYAPLYLTTRLREPEKRFNAIVSSVLMLAGGGMLLGLTNTHLSYNVTEGLYQAHHVLDQQQKQLAASNNLLYTKTNNNESVRQMREASDALYNFLDDIKAQLISTAEDIPVADAAKLDLLQMHHPENTSAVKMVYLQNDGPYSVEKLREQVKSYNRSMSTYFDADDFVILNEEDVPSALTLVPILCHHLTQLQMQVEANELAFLNRNMALSVGK
ncbi:MAG: hypothetical protein H6585_07615 [Flavobacteriales bacterium]|nr:hypothetical protein [Flavobacteriales bacterium]MCB9448194.1 hypothetical protein [Flavobacteriales bacterium]